MILKGNKNSGKKYLNYEIHYQVYNIVLSTFNIQFFYAKA